MKTIFVNRFFYPDHSATSQLLTELAFELAAKGLNIHVLSSRQRYDGSGASLAVSECVKGVKIHRVWSTTFGRRHLIGRFCDYITFYSGVLFCLMRLLRSEDTVVAKTDPPLLSVVVAFATGLKGAKLVNWIQDLFPEVASSLGFRLAGGPVGKILRLLRNSSLRAAHANVAIGERMAEIVRDQIGRRPAVIHNWPVGILGQDESVTSESVRVHWQLGDKFVVAYSGNLGRAHDISTLLGAVELLRCDSRVLFLFVGGGKQFEDLRAETAARGLGDQVKFATYQPLERLYACLGAADVHLISLRPELEGLIVPSKFYGVIAAQRPVIFVGDPNGEVASMTAVFGCGESIPAGDCSALAECILRLKADPARCRAMGESGGVAAKRYSLRAASDHWVALLNAVTANKAVV